MTETVETTNTMSSKTEPLTKSQKKRIKRNRAKKKREVEKEKTEITSLNPIEKLVNDVAKLGFARDEIDISLDEMWNKQLDYGDFDAVVEYIRNKNNGGMSSVEVPVPTVAVAENTINNESLEEMKTNTSNSVVTSPISPFNSEVDLNFEPGTSSNDSINNVSTTNISPREMSSPFTNTLQKAETLTEHVESNGCTPKSPVLFKKKVRIKPVGISAKLEIVAQTDNLSDGIIAMSEWVTKAATVPEIKELCCIGTINPLHIVIKRSTLSHDNSSTGQLLDLISCILRSVGVKSTESLGTMKSIANLLKVTKLNLNDDPTLKEKIASGVAESLVEQIGKTINQMNCITSTNATPMKRLHEEIRKLQLAMRKSSGSEIMDLMSRRDKSKCVAEKYISIVELQANKFLISGVGGNTTQDHMMSQTDVTIKILGDQYDDITQSEEKVEDLKLRHDQSESSSSLKVNLAVEISAMERDHTRVRSRIEELEKELKSLHAKEHEITQKINNSKEKSDGLVSAMADKEKEVDALIDIYSNRIKVKKSVSNVASEVCAVAKSLDTLIQSRMSNEDKSAQEISDYPDFVGDLLSSLLHYFESELQTMNFLEKRAGSVEKKALVLRREIVECQALGMTSTVIDMKKQEQKMIQDIMDDHDLIEGCLDETKVARRTYVGKICDCLSTGLVLYSNSEKSLFSEILKKINAVEEKLGIDDGKCQHWNPLIVAFKC